MSREHYFVTGALGCIGAWVLRNLVAQGVAVTAFDLSTDRHRLQLIMSADELARISFVQGDITDTDIVRQAVTEAGTTHLIHLAALQVPFCKANPPVGAAVNVVGTVNIFEAARAVGLRQVVYASSLAVYGTRAMYGDRLLTADAPLYPLNHYGVFKQANEGTARIYWQDEGIASVGLRPYTVYGPGRDQGLTSSPTQAMLAAARGEAYHIGYGGSNGFQLADDIAKLLVMAAERPFEGAAVFNVKGTVAHMREVVTAIELAQPQVSGRITFEATPLPFADGQDDAELRTWLGPIPDTSLEDGVAATIAHFKAAVADGRL